MEHGWFREPFRSGLRPEFRRDWEVARWLGKGSLGEFYELDEVDQDEAIVLWTEQQERCQQCGNPRRLCADPETVWYPQRAVCFASMAQAAAQAAYEDLHGEKRAWHSGDFTQWSAKRVPNPDKPHEVYDYPASAGVKVHVAPFDIDPGDEFTTRHDAQPSALRAQQAVEQDDQADDQGESA